MVVLLRNFVFLMVLVFSVPAQAAPGSRIGFTIEQNGSVINQIAEGDVTCKLCTRDLATLKPARIAAGRSWPPEWACAA